MDPLTSADGNVEVMIPLDLRNASIVRVVAAALGADSGYSMDEIDDFRLALNEAFALLVDASPAPARAHITFTPGHGELTATLQRSDGIPPATPDTLTAGILRAVVDGMNIDGPVIRLQKRAAELAAAPPPTP